MFQLSSRPQSFWDLLVDSLRVYKAIYLRTFFFFLLYTAMLLMPNVFLYLSAHTKGTPFHPLWHSASEAVAGAIELWFLAVIFHSAYQIITQSKVTLAQSCLVATRKYFIYVIASLLFAIMSVIGFTVLFLPGVFIQVLLGFFIFFILFENDGIIASMKHSAELVWGNWWRCFVFFMIPVICMIIVIEAFTHGFSFPVGFLYENAVEVSTLSSQFILWVLLMIFVPWLTSIMLCLYHDMKLRREIGLGS